MIYYREDLYNCRQEDSLRTMQDLGAVGVVEIARLTRGFATFWCVSLRRVIPADGV